MAIQDNLWFNLAFALLTTLAYYGVGRVISRRPVSPEAGLAKQSFMGFWYGLAAVTALGAVASIAGRYDVWTVSSLYTYTQVVLFAILAALGALLYYFVYLFTGKRGAWKPIALFYFLFFIAILYLFAVMDPIGLKEADGGGVEIDYANDDDSGTDYTQSPLVATLGLLLLVPILVGAVGYISLVRKVTERSGRFRIIAVAGAFILWFGSSLLAGQVFDISDEDWWAVVSRLISLLAAFMVYAAFHPPGWVQSMFRIEGYDHRSSSPEAPLESDDGSK